LKQELIKSKEFNDKLSANLVKEIKLFVKNFILSIPNYKIDLYGNKEELGN
jgi:hypothetical protein